jgi:cytochrome c553
MKKLPIFVLLSASMLVIAPTYAGDAAAGKTKSEACVDCHGDDGKGDDDNPNIAGMPVEKFTKAMTEYQNGTRTKDAKMAKAAKKLTAADVADLAAYYAKLK